ncbi:MAG: carbohydrate ABC transporter substrate-binding protein [Pseudobacteriovorax sp.]|nr:carbohydrate ABC transporter substrate-binding protein [Pseudobacteriovorax sp.]
MKLIPFLLAASMLASPAIATELEVIHWWTSGGEAKSVDSLKSMFKKTGHTWKDSKIIGGGGANANKAIKQRVSSGNAPGVVQLKSTSLPQWGTLGALQDVDKAAANQGWDKILPKKVLESLKYNNKFVSAPVNVHRINWMWMSKKVLDKSGAKVPTSIPELFSTLDKIKKAGFTPIAHGGQPWQDATLFEEILLGVGGADLYNKVLVDLDSSAAKSPKMLEVFKTLRKISTYLPKDRKGLDWDKATKLIIDNKAGMQFMGDWAKGEFMTKNLVPGKDFICAPAPGTDKAFIYTIDAFAFFKTKGDKAVAAQNKLAETIMTKEFQNEFNKRKGSIPVRTDMDMSGFDSCAKQSADTFRSSDKSNTLVPSFAHGNAQSSDVQGPIVEIVSVFINSNMSPKEGVAKLADTLEEFE